MKIKLVNSIFYLYILLTLGSVAIRIFNLFAPIAYYPFAIFWSESGRIYNSYQIFNLFGADAIKSFPWLDPARAILDSLAFLIPSVTILKWRVWVASISIITMAVTSFLIVLRAIRNQKLMPARRLIFLILFTLFGTLFFFQGPIYAHLLIGIVPILLFYRQDKPKITLIIVAICAIWSGLTRVNWFFMPAIIASLLYVLKQPRQKMPAWRYFCWPFIWGMTNLIISLPIYFWALGKANQPSILNPELKYGFEVAKLWPNAGYTFGLIPGIFLVTAPMLFIIMRYLWLQRHSIDKLRIAFLLLLLSGLAAGSTLMSLRAGGGFDLHNYDTVLLVVFIIAIQIGFREVQPDEDNIFSGSIFFHPITIGILLIVPIFLSVRAIKPAPVYDYVAAQDAIKNINLALKENASKQESQVLFIDYRPLVVFGQVPPRPIYNSYEKVELMEMAMAQNKLYFQQFTDTLSQHKFDLIITPLLWQGEQLQGENPFWYENNSWSNYVVAPILEYYESGYTNREADLQIYYPKP